MNIPWPSGGFGDGDYIYAFQKIVMPIAYEFNPDLVISKFSSTADIDELTIKSLPVSTLRKATRLGSVTSRLQHMDI